MTECLQEAEPTAYKTGLGNAVDKDTKWIWHQDARCSVNHWVEFRQLIKLDQVAGVELRIAADTAYQLWINERLVDDAYFSEYPEDRYFHAIDISPYLQQRYNCVAILGYYQGIDTSRYVTGKPGLWFEMRQGGAVLLKSSTDCRARTSRGYVSGNVPLVTTQLGLTIEYDASLDDGWKSVDYDDSVWESADDVALAYEFSSAGLRPYPLKRFDIAFREARLLCSGRLENAPEDGTPARIMSHTALHPHDAEVGASQVLLEAVPDGSFAIFDLGRESCGFLHLEVDAEADTVIDMAHGEHLEDGRVRAWIEGRNFADRYIARAGPQTWSMPVRKLGCRYLELHVRNNTGTVKIRSLGLKTVEYPTRDHDGFRCSDPLIEKVMDVSERTAKLCMLESYADTPWREQALYTMDAAVQALCGYYLFGEYDYPEKCYRALGKRRFCEHYLSMCAPGRMDITIPGFTFIWIAAVRDYTLYSGRCVLAKESFSYIKTVIFGLLDHLQDGLLKINPSQTHWNFYEWSPGMDGSGPWEEDDTEYHICHTLFFLKAIRAYNDLCSYLGSEMQVQQSVIAEMSAKLHELFFCEDKRLYANAYPGASDDGFSELTQALACCFLDVKHNRDDLKAIWGKADSTLVPASLSMQKYVFWAMDAVLNDDGRSVLDRIRRDWGFMISQGATSFWETLDGAAAFNGAGSLCHGWSIMPVYYIYSEIIGIKPLSPGFKQFSLSPKTADLEFIQGRVPTPDGDINVRWQRNGRSVELEIEYPAALELVNRIDGRHDIILNIRRVKKEGNNQRLIG